MVTLCPPMVVAERRDLWAVAVEALMMGREPCKTSAAEQGRETYLLVLLLPSSSSLTMWFLPSAPLPFGHQLQNNSTSNYKMK